MDSNTCQPYPYSTTAPWVALPLASRITTSSAASWAMSAVMP